MPPEPPVLLSIIVPVRNDATALERLLDSLAPPMDTRSVEVIIVDGASTDGSTDVALRRGYRVVRSDPGRGRQLNAGCRVAAGEWLWLVHADALVTAPALGYLRRLRAPGWGRFDVRFPPSGPGLKVVARFMNWRSRATGICTGDQGIFLHRRLLEAVYGVPEQPLMEDVELSRRLKRLSRPLCPEICLPSSPRRWQRDGLIPTVLAMWRFRLRYWWGEDPEDLARCYYGSTS